jgi:hypothetical protein
MMVMAPLDDPKFCTKPWVFIKGNFYRMKNQEFAEALCVPSVVRQHRDTLARPLGIGFK